MPPLIVPRTNTRFFLRVIIATIRDKGICLCPRCLVPKSGLSLMGQLRDLSFRSLNPRRYLLEKVQLAREFMYTRGKGIMSAAVNHLLQETSSIPTLVSSGLFLFQLLTDLPIECVH